MDFGNRLASWTTRRPGRVTAAIVAITLLIAVVAALPSLWPAAASVLSPIRVDTDPENMLRAEEPVRVRNHELKREFALHDMLVVGVVNTEQGVFNPETLAKVDEVTRYALTLNGEVIGAEEGQGVIARDVIAPGTVDRIEPGEAGEIGFSWLMREPPATPEGAAEIKAAAQRLPRQHAGERGRRGSRHLPPHHREEPQLPDRLAP
jgi:hypothetical protein